MTQSTVFCIVKGVEAEFPDTKRYSEDYRVAAARFVDGVKRVSFRSLTTGLMYSEDAALTLHIQTMS